MMKAIIAVVSIFFVLVYIVCVTHGRSIHTEHEDLSDTYESIGEEQLHLAGRRLHKRSTLLSEIMGPLSRNVRSVDEKTRSQEVYKRMGVLLTILRMLIGDSPRIEIMQFSNWDKTINIDQLFYVKVRSIWEVRRVILAARTLGMRVRATGQGHTRSPLYVDEGNIMMDVRDLQRHDGPTMQLNGKTEDRDFQTVTAMTGVIEVNLNRFLTEKKVAILAQPLNDQESLGGMVAVSTHGSTWNGVTYSGIVVELRLLDSRGRLRRFVKERHPEMFKAVMCNLGMFGIMYDITFKVEPTFIVRVENDFVPLKDILLSKEALGAQLKGNFLTELSWFPFNSVRGEMAKKYEKNGEIPASWNAGDDEVWVRTMNRASEDEIVDQTILGPNYMNTSGSLSGGSVKGLLKGGGSVSVAKKMPQKSYHQVVNAFPVILPPKWGTETSAAFMLNVDNSFDRAVRALQFLVNKTENQIKGTGTTPMNALMPRFFLNHDCLLCPGNHDIVLPNDSNHTMVLDFLAPPTQDGFYQAAEDFVSAFKSEKVRPHWAKRYDNIDGIIQHIQDVFGNNLDEFNRQKQLAGVDPCDTFMNGYLLAIFGRNPECFHSY